MFGGYPKVITEQEASAKRIVMDEVFTSYITKDITYLLGVRAPEQFVKLIKLLAVQSGGILNYSQLCNDSGLTLATLKNYLWYAEQTFIIDLITPYFTNAKKEITKAPVVYFNDVGMNNFAQGIYGSISEVNKGFIFQSFVYSLLKARWTKGLNKVNYWRTKDKAEVDFIVHEEGRIIPIEVKYSDLKKTAITRSFRSFIYRYSPAKAYVVNLTLENQMKINDTEIEFIPYWKLMFMDD
jgi:predicted AAA+ superfamily ATPase